MEITYIGNIIEGIFWLGVSMFFFVPAMKRPERNRLFCITGGVVFVVFGLSDFYEAHTGAWYRPWWLILWNVACVGGIVVVLLWYARICGSISAAIDSMKKPIRLRRSKNVES